MSTAQHIALVVHTRGFGKWQLAKIFGVSRWATYDWLRGGNARDENADRLEKLARLVLAVSGDTRRPLYHRFASRPIAEGEASLLDLLRTDRWDETRTLAQLRRARTLTTQRQRRQDKARSPASRSRRDGNLTDNPRRNPAVASTLDVKGRTPDAAQCQASGIPAHGLEGDGVSPKRLMPPLGRGRDWNSGIRLSPR